MITCVWNMAISRLQISPVLLRALLTGTNQTMSSNFTVCCSRSIWVDLMVILMRSRFYASCYEFRRDCLRLRIRAAATNNKKLVSGENAAICIIQIRKSRLLLAFTRTIFILSLETDIFFLLLFHSSSWVFSFNLTILPSKLFSYIVI